MEEGAKFFKLFIGAAPKVCIENPIMHKYAKEIIGKTYTQIVQPWQFGHMESKATCLWLEGLPKIKETNNVKQEMKELPIREQYKVWYAGGGKGKERSRFFEGIAEAMADQWG